MQKQWPKELTTELSEEIARCISKFNAAHSAESNISQEQGMKLKHALEVVFGQHSVAFEFTSKT